MKPEKKAKLTEQIASLERRLFEAKASYAATLGTAFDSIPKAGHDIYMGSGVIITVRAIGGKEITPPFMLRDGLSPETVKALQSDIARSFELATMVNPAMAATRFPK